MNPLLWVSRLLGKSGSVQDAGMGDVPLWRWQCGRCGRYRKAEHQCRKG